MRRKNKEAPWRGYQNAENSEQTTCSEKLEQGKSHLDQRMSIISTRLPAWSISHIDLAALQVRKFVMYTWGPSNLDPNDRSGKWPEGSVMDSLHGSFHKRRKSIRRGTSNGSKPKKPADMVQFFFFFFSRSSYIRHLVQLNMFAPVMYFVQLRNVHFSSHSICLMMLVLYFSSLVKLPEE